MRLEFELESIRDMLNVAPYVTTLRIALGIPATATPVALRQQKRVTVYASCRGYG